MSSLIHTHETVSHGYFDHTRAGLKHLIIQGRAKIARIVQEIKDVDQQIAALVREFHKLADIHEVWYQHIPGYESATFRIESQMDTAHHYRWGMIGGMMIAIVLGTYFSVSTLIAQSFLVLLLSSVVVAIVIGIIASLILRALLGASSVNPHASRNVNVTLVVVGTLFFCLLAFFAWIRLKSESELAALLPIVMVGLELSAIIFAGACDCGYRMYRWSGTLSERHRGMVKRKNALEDRLANEHVTLHDLEYRLHNHEDQFLGKGEVHHHEHHHEHDSYHEQKSHS